MTTGTGEQSTPYGEHPLGYLSYSADGRMQVIGTASGGAVPGDPTPTMFAYAGTYSVEAGKVTHHVDVSWNEVWNGTDQVRFYEVNANTLTITARDIDGQYVVVWEKVTNPG